MITALACVAAAVWLIGLFAIVPHAVREIRKANEVLAGSEDRNLAPVPAGAMVRGSGPR